MSDAKQAAKRAVAKMNAVRNFPDGTCPASRHVAMMAEELAKGKTYHMLTEEPEHCAASMAATVAALWECRTKLAQQDDLVQAAVAAALREAAECCTAQLRNTAMLLSNPPKSSAAWDARNAILDLITPDAQAALDRVVAAALTEEVRALIYASKAVMHDLHHGNGLEGLYKNRDRLEAALSAFEGDA